MGARCTTCGAALELPCACTACGALQPLAAERDPWAELGFQPRIDMDEAALRKRLLSASRLVHPDFHGADESMRALAEAHSARLNRAHAVLADEARRADALVGLLGGPDESSSREMPREFLLEVLEWNEALEEARAARAWSGSIALLRDELASRRGAELAAVRELLDPAPAHGDARLQHVRSRLNAVRYLDRALGELEALRLSATRA
jgi:molecular chaperone HscB